MRRLLIYLFAILPFAGYSQTVLTLDECVRLAKENNKRMEAAEQQLKSSLYEKRSVRALFLPSFSLTGSALYSTADGSYSSGMGQLPVLGADGVPTGQSALFPGIDLAYDLGWIYGGGVKVDGVAMERKVYNVDPALFSVGTVIQSGKKRWARLV